MAMSRSRPERLWQDLLPGRDRHAREQSGLGVGIGGGEGFGGLPVGKIDHQQRADHRLAVLAEQRAGGEYLAADAAEMSEMGVAIGLRSEEHTSELQSLLRISYAVFCLKTHTRSDNGMNDNTDQIQDS